MDDRKIAELNLFDSIYEKSSDNVDPEKRVIYLRDSEEYFTNLISSECKGKNVLEIGCGAGKHSIHAAICGAVRVYGIDISQHALTLARQSAAANGVDKIAEFREMDAESLNFEDNFFDIIINHETFSSLDLKSALPEMYRVLKDGGKIIGKETFGHNPVFNLKRIINGLLGTRTKWLISHIMKSSDLDYASSMFRSVDAKYFHLISPLCYPFKFFLPNKANLILVEQVRNFDRILLSVKFLQKYAFKCVFSFIK